MEQSLELQLLFVWICASMSIAIIVPVGVYVADHVQHHPLRDCVRTTDGVAAPTPSAAIIGPALPIIPASLSDATFGSSGWGLIDLSPPSTSRSSSMDDDATAWPLLWSPNGRHFRTWTRKRKPLTESERQWLVSIEDRLEWL